MLLRAAAGETDADIADDLGISAQTAANVRKRFAAEGLDAALTELETRMVRDTLAAAGGNQSEAARRLGISRVGLVKKLTRLGLR